MAESTTRTRSRRAVSPILAGAREALAIAEGREVPGAAVHIPAELDVAAIRRARKMTQAAFAATYGFSLARLRDWEQRRHAPDSLARAYLLVIRSEPAAVARALKAG